MGTAADQIRVSDRVKRVLDRLRREGESYNDVLERVLDEERGGDTTRHAAASDALAAVYAACSRCKRGHAWLDSLIRPVWVPRWDQFQPVQRPDGYARMGDTGASFALHR